MDGGHDLGSREAHVQSASPVRAGFLWGLKDEVVGCRWVVMRDSGEAVGEVNGTVSSPYKKVSDQGSRFGLVMSVPLHICQF